MADAAYYREYRKRNREKIKASVRRYQEAHREELRLRAAEYRENNPDEVRATRARHFAAHKEKIRRKQAESRRAHPELLRSRNAEYRRKRGRRQVPADRPRANMRVRRAVAKGILAKEPCSVCGAPRAHAHHEDYSKPLAVTWLCCSHHQLRHQEINEAKA